MNREALKQAVDNLAIQMIYLCSTDAHLCNDFDPLLPNQELEGQYNIGVKSCFAKEFIDESGSKLRFLVYQTEARMRYLKGPISDELKNDLENEEQLEKLMAAEIVATYVSQYAINCDDELSPDAVLEFGRVNVPHQIWAYWREYCHATCARMALPVSILPMYIINKVTDSER